LGKGFTKVVRLFSLKRIVLSIVLGFLLPLAYAFALSLLSDMTGKTAPAFMVVPFGWPRPLWVFLMGRQPTEADVLSGLLFLAACNIVLYGTIVYVTLLMFSLFSSKRVDYQSPPPPEPFPPQSQ
jgi:hypothetical protein